LTFAVHDEFNTTPVEDTMTIDVYDDACWAALMGLSRLDPADFNRDCIVSLEDIAVMAAKWLIDNSSTAPVAK